MQETLRRLLETAERWDIELRFVHTPGVLLHRPDQTSRGDPIEEPRVRLAAAEFAAIERLTGRSPSSWAPRGDTPPPRSGRSKGVRVEAAPGPPSRREPFLSQGSKAGSSTRPLRRRRRHPHLPTSPVDLEALELRERALHICPPAGDDLRGEDHMAEKASQLDRLRLGRPPVESAPRQPVRDHPLQPLLPRLGQGDASAAWKLHMRSPRNSMHRHGPRALCGAHSRPISWQTASKTALP